MFFLRWDAKRDSKKALPLKNLLRTLLRSVRLHDPLGVRPNQNESPLLTRFNLKVEIYSLLASET